MLIKPWGHPIPKANPDMNGILGVIDSMNKLFHANREHKVNHYSLVTLNQFSWKLVYNSSRPPATIELDEPLEKQLKIVRCPASGKEITQGYYSHGEIVWLIPKE